MNVYVSVSRRLCLVYGEKVTLKWVLTCGETRPDWHQLEVATTEDEPKDKRHWPQVRPAPIMLSSFIEDRGGGGGGETHIYRNDQVASFLLFSSSSNISIIGKISAARWFCLLPPAPLHT